MFHPSTLAAVEESAAKRAVQPSGYFTVFVQPYGTWAKMQASALHGGYVLQIGLKRRVQALDAVGGDIHVEHLAAVEHPVEF